MYILKEGRKTMEYDKIKQLMEDMGNSKLTEIAIDFPDGTKISMKKEEKQVVVEAVSTKEALKVENVEVQEATLNKAEEKVLEGNVVTSPMVGTFYIKPSPEATPYVEIGTDVKKGTDLCIVEAMKLMNEIESEYAGKISKILVEDGKAVEYGTPLFEIEI